MATQSRSPSPAPHPPIATTPGPRASTLLTLYAKSLDKTLRTCSYANFSACFPTPARYAPEVLKGLWTQVVGKIRERGEVEFESICAERDVVGGLNELERLVGEARGRMGRGEMGIGAHLLPPETLYLASLRPFLMDTEVELEGRLEGVQRENEGLVGDIRKQREEVERLVGGLESVIRDLEGANEVMDGVVVEGELGKEVMEVESELKASGRGAKL